MSDSTSSAQAHALAPDASGSGVSQHRKVGWVLWVGILFLPFIFSWLLLRRGYARRDKIIAFTWMVVYILGGLKSEVQHLAACKVRECRELNTANSSRKNA